MYSNRSMYIYKANTGYLPVRLDNVNLNTL